MKTRWAGKRMILSGKALEALIPGYYYHGEDIEMGSAYIHRESGEILYGERAALQDFAKRQAIKSASH